jgi:hypothetical protein
VRGKLNNDHNLPIHTYGIMEATACSVVLHRSPPHLGWPRCYQYMDIIISILVYHLNRFRFHMPVIKGSDNWQKIKGLIGAPASQPCINLFHLWHRFSLQPTTGVIHISCNTYFNIIPSSQVTAIAVYVGGLIEENGLYRVVHFNGNT